MKKEFTGNVDLVTRGAKGMGANHIRAAINQPTVQEPSLLSMAEAQ